MSDLKTLSQKVADAFKARSSEMGRSSLFMKYAFAVLSGVSVIAQFTGSEKWVHSNYVGISTAIAATMAAIYVAFTDRDSSSELETAREAVILAQEAQREAEDLQRAFAEFREFEIEQLRARELYQAMFSMRGVVERVIGASDIDATKAITLLIEVAKRSLTVALGYQMAEHHTLGVYIAETDPTTHKTVLRCVAHSRTIDCPVDDARKWPSGVGVGGAAYARGTEVVVPDMTALEIGSLYRDIGKDEDGERYKSIAAVPVFVGGSQTDPWGVVIGTSDRREHFVIGDEGPAVQTVEAIRALAGMVALAVRATEINRQGHPTGAATNV